MLSERHPGKGLSASDALPSAGEFREGSLLAGAGAAEGRTREIELDFLRGLAILMVLDFHAPVHWMSYPFQRLGFPNFGWAGVDLFFVLSGFLVGGVLIKEWRLHGTVDSRRFLIRRGFKIWPMYYVFLLLMLVTRHRSVDQLWGNLLNIQNYTGGIPHTWSLAVEEHAYLLLALLMAVAARWQLRARSLAVGLVAVCAAVVGSRLWLIEHGHAVVNRTHTRIEGILYGVLLALLFHYRPERFRKLQQQRWVWALLLGGALLFLRLQTQAPWATSLGWDAADLLGVALLMLLYRPGSAKRRSWPYRLVAWIGVYSYGIYLWHVAVLAPVLSFAGRLPSAWANTWLAVMPVLGGVALGAAFTKAVELPALNLRDRLFPRQIGSPVLASAHTPERRSEVQTAARVANA